MREDRHQAEGPACWVPHCHLEAEPDSIQVIVPALLFYGNCQKNQWSGEPGPGMGPGAGDGARQEELGVRVALGWEGCWKVCEIAGVLEEGSGKVLDPSLTPPVTLDVMSPTSPLSVCFSNGKMY